MKLLDINSPEAIKEPEIPQKDLEKYIPAELGVTYCHGVILSRSIVQVL